MESYLWLSRFSQLIAQLHERWKENNAAFDVVLQGVHPSCSFEKLLDIKSYLERTAPSRILIRKKETGQEYWLEEKDFVDFSFQGKTLTVSQLDSPVEIPLG